MISVIEKQLGWKFEEHQRDAVCKGELCPACLGKNIKCVDHHFDGINMNAAFDCLDCKAEWEGY